MMASIRSFSGFARVASCVALVAASLLMDSTGRLGHLYDAETTAQMSVIDPAGKMIYNGAIDNRPTPDQEDIKGADNYLNDALSAAMADRPVAVNHSRPYCCSVKYAD